MSYDLYFTKPNVSNEEFMAYFRARPNYECPLGNASTRTRIQEFIFSLITIRLTPQQAWLLRIRVLKASGITGEALPSDRVLNEEIVAKFNGS
jgi:hypothetical protein